MRHAAVTVVAIVFAAALHATPASAQLVRTFISATGSDSNNCARPTPCRTLQEAHNKTAAKGEINMLDPAGYGAVTITKAISIINDGVGSAGILAGSGQSGITINAGAGDAINLRGLIIEGAGIGQTGLLFNTGKSLTVENCVIRGFTGNGFEFTPSTSTTLAVSNVLFASNDDNGVIIQPVLAGSVNATFNRIEVIGNGVFGFYADGLNAFASSKINLTAMDSVFFGNAFDGISLSSNPGEAPVSLTLIRSTVSNNNTGVRANASGVTVRIGETQVTGNVSGWVAQSGATVLSYTNNYIDGNGSNETAPPLIAKK